MRLLYTVDPGYAVYLYKEIDPDYVAPLTDEQIYKLAVKEAQEKNENEVRELMNSFRKNHYEFIKTVKITKKSQAALDRYVVLYMNRGIGYNTAGVVNVLQNLIDFEINKIQPDDGLADATVAALETGRGVLYTLFAKMATVSRLPANNVWNSDLKLYLTEHSDHESVLDYYSFLTDLGYEVPDEEASVVNGTHKIFENEWAKPFIPEPEIKEEKENGEEVAA